MINNWNKEKIKISLLIFIEMAFFNQFVSSTKEQLIFLFLEFEFFLA